MKHHPQQENRAWIGRRDPAKTLETYERKAAEREALARERREAATPGTPK